jgi:tRNA-dihydrouridine synthase B
MISVQPNQASTPAAFRVGSIEVDGRALLAPMSGVTDAAMRRIARRFGASLVVSEMVASDALARGDALARLRAEGAGIDPHMVQLAGCQPHWMAQATRVAQAAGAAIIDINMGCPAKRVTGGYAGSALMRDLDHALRLIEATVAAASVPVTLKMRLGWDHASLNAPELARRAEATGVALITVHGRTRCQFYQGQADWSAIAAVKAAVGIPVVANGDCHSLADARRMIECSGADAVMVGRAALGQPWLPGAIARGLAGAAPRELAPSLRLAVALEHYDALLSAYGVAVGLRHARKHLAAYADKAAASGLRVPLEVRDALVRSADPARVRGLLTRIFTSPMMEKAA